MTCRSCQYLDVRPDSRGRVIPRRDKSYRCLAPEPARPIVPASVTPAYLRWPPHRSHMEPDDGAECPCHEPRAAAPTEPTPTESN